jgi:hypothetical protein
MAMVYCRRRRLFPFLLHIASTEYEAMGHTRQLSATAGESTALEQDRFHDAGNSRKAARVTSNTRYMSNKRGGCTIN